MSSDPEDSIITVLPLRRCSSPARTSRWMICGSFFRRGSSGGVEWKTGEGGGVTGPEVRLGWEKTHLLLCSGLDEL